jgi:hypothetical protein
VQCEEITLPAEIKCNKSNLEEIENTRSEQTKAKEGNKEKNGRNGRVAFSQPGFSVWSALVDVWLDWPLSSPPYILPVHGFSSFS